MCITGWKSWFYAISICIAWYLRSSTVYYRHEYQPSEVSRAELSVCRDWSQNLLLPSVPQTPLLDLSQNEYLRVKELRPLHPMILHFLTNLFEEFTCLFHKPRTSGKPISSHGFAGPLKWITEAASNISLGTSGDRAPNPATCHNGSIWCTWPSNAITAGGIIPGRHNVNPDSWLCETQIRYISISGLLCFMRKTCPVFLFF